MSNLAFISLLTTSGNQTTILPSLYSLDSKGSVREWSVGVVNFGNYSTIFVQHGLRDGQKQLRETKITKGKNIGKANETDHYTQALSEARSKWNKQKDKGYGDTPKKRFSPMLAHRFDKQKKKVVYPCIVQGKMDGCRNYFKHNGEKWECFSRMGKRFPLFDCIGEELPDTSVIYDGELYVHGWGFERIVAAVKRDEPNEDTDLVEFHCYDYYSENDEGNFKRAEKLYHDLIHKKRVKTVTSVQANSEEDVIKLHDIFVQDGYEGAMVRNYAAKYEPDKRSYNLLKVKLFETEEFEIVDVEQDKDEAAVFVCKCENGTFGVRPEGSLELRQEYLNKANELIGKMLTVRFFEYTADKVPRFPVGLAVRDYE